MQNINRIIIQRLILAWLIASLLTGAGIYLLETKRIDNALIALASTEAARFSPDGIDTKNLTPPELESFRQQALAFVRKNSVVMTAYDHQDQKIFDTTNPAFEQLRSQLTERMQRFPHDGEDHFKTLNIDGRTLVQTRTALRSPSGHNAGYIETVFVVPPESLARLREDLMRLLLIAQLCVLCMAMLLYPALISLNRRVIRFSDKVIKGNLEIVTVLGAAIAERDSDTGDHNYRVTLYAIRLAEAVGIAAIDMRALILGAFLHDVGKIGIRDSILLKPAALNDDELAIMRTHVLLGVGIIKTSDWLQAARDVIECHHEKYDGSGYMKGLRGEDIPLVARIFAIVDVFDALTSKRPYKEAWPVEDALASLSQDAGSRFDPQLVAVFQNIAADLYRQFGQADEAELNACLRELVKLHYLQLITQIED